MGVNGQGGKPWARGGARFLLYSHDGMGLGHLRRNLAVASALMAGAPDSAVLLVTGSGDAERLGLQRGMDILKLPALRKLGHGRYGARRLPIPSDELKALRAGMIAAAVRSFRPHVMLVDKHPAGAHAELRPALDELRASGGRAVVGFRDVLDDPEAVLREWRLGGDLQLIVERYAAVLVYGNPAVLDFRSAYALPEAVARRSQYTGYVVHAASSRDAGVDTLPAVLLAPRSWPLVVASVGGGEDGGRILRTFIEAARGAPWRGIVVAGPEVRPDVRHALRRTAVEAGVGFHGFAHDLPSWFPQVDALVCMGGYNTLAEALFRGTPTVCVPRSSSRVEQLIRARAFARLGLLRLLEPAELGPEALRREIAEALAGGRDGLAERAYAALDFGGARRAADALLELAGRPDAPSASPAPTAAVE